MADKYDGSIVIDTELDQTGFEKGSKELLQAIKNLTEKIDAIGKMDGVFDSSGMEKSEKQVQDVDARLNQMAGTVEEVKARVDELGKAMSNASNQEINPKINPEMETGGTSAASKAAANGVGSLDRAMESFANVGFSSLMQEIRAISDELVDLGNLGKNAISFGNPETMAKFESTFSSVEKHIQSMQEVLEKLGETTVETSEYQAAKAQLEDIEAKMAAVQAEKQELLDAGNAEGSEAMSGVDSKLSELAEKANLAKARLKALEEVGLSQTLLKDTQGFKTLSGSVESYKTTLDNLRTTVDQYKEGVESAASADLDTSKATGKLAVFKMAIDSVRQKLSELKEKPVVVALKKITVALGAIGGTVVSYAIAGVATAIRGIGKAAKFGLSKLLGMAKGLARMAGGAIRSGLSKVAGLVKNIGRSARNSGMSFKTMFGAVLGAKGAYALLRKIFATAQEGMGALAQKDKAFNAAMSGYTSAMARLKNSITAAFAPIATAALPLMTRLANAASEAATKIGMVFAALTGQKSFTQAVTVQKDYADSVNKSTKAQKKQGDELKRQAAAFDQFNILTDNSKDDEDEAEDPGAGFETVPIESSMSKLAERIKQAWKDADFYDLGYDLGTRIKEALDSIPWERAQEMAYKLGKSLATLINGFTAVPGLATSMGKTVAEAINTIFHALDGFGENFDWAQMGTFIREGILGALTNIDWKLIYKVAKEYGTGIGTMIENALNDPTLWKNIFGTLANGINSIVYFLGNLIRSVNWEEFAKNIAEGLNNGVRTIDWQAIAQMLTDGLNGAFSFMYNFIKTFDWYGFAFNIASTISYTLQNTDWSTFGASLGAFINGIFDSFKGFIDGMDWKALVDSIVNFIVGFFSEIDWSQFGETFSTLFINLCTALSTKIQETDWQQVVKNITDAFKDFFDGFDWAGLASSVASLIGAAFGAAVAIGSELWEKMKEFGRNIIDGGWEGIKEKMSAAGEWIKTNILDPFINAFKTAFGINSPATTMKPLGSNIIAGVWEGIKEKLRDVGDWVKNNIFTPVLTAFKTAFGIAGEKSDAFRKQGKHIISGVFAGIKEKLTNVKEWFSTNVKDKLINAFKTVFRIHSPSKEMEEQGKYLASGIGEGIKNGWSSAESALKSGAGKLASIFKNQNWGQLGSYATSHIASGMNFGTIVNSMRNGANNAAAAFANGASWYNAGAFVDSGLAQGIYGHSAEVINAAQYAAVEAYNAACYALGIASPSKKFAWIAKMMIEGMSGGIFSNTKTATDAVSDLAEAVVAEAENESPTLDIDIAGTLDGLDAILTSFSDKFVNGFAEMVASLQNVAQGFMVPAVASGSIIPYGSQMSMSAGMETSNTELLNQLRYMQSQAATKDELRNYINNAAQSWPIVLYLGDEQVARAANRGNERIERRYNR